MENKLNIINNHLKFQKVKLIEPATSYYLHIAAEIDHSFFPFFFNTSSKKKQIIEQSKEWCKEIELLKEIISAVVFKAKLIPPGKGQFIKERKAEVTIARFDFAILIEAASADIIERIQLSDGYKKIVQSIREVSLFTHIIPATNARRINSVDHSRPGIFLFNYFFAADIQQNLAVWEYTAGWFQQETKLNNSTVLLPADQSQSSYTLINHCRWDKLSDILPSLLFKKTFRSYVLDNFYANNAGAMPILYKLA